jgi:NitT/TauT family transport system permease protein
MRATRHLATAARTALVAVVVLALLQAFALMGWLPPTIPSPLALLKALGNDDRMLLVNAWATLQAAAAGYAVACAFSLALTLLVAFLPRAEAYVYNAALVFHTLPLLVLAPILVIWFGLGLQARIVIAALAAYYFVLIGGLHGLRASAGRATELMHVLAASPGQMFFKVRLPYALPALFAGLKLGATGAVLGAVVAEWTGAETGLGVMMSYALFSFQVERVWLAMLTMMALATLVFLLVQWAEKRLLGWASSDAPLGAAA